MAGAVVAYSEPATTQHPTPAGDRVASPSLSGATREKPQGLYPHRAPHRGRHHRHSRRDRDPEVQLGEAEGLSYAGDLGSDLAPYVRRDLLTRFEPLDRTST